MQVAPLAREIRACRSRPGALSSKLPPCARLPCVAPTRGARCGCGPDVKLPAPTQPLPVCLPAHHFPVCLPALQPRNGWSHGELLRLLGSLERSSTHPLAAAVLGYAAAQARGRCGRGRGRGVPRARQGLHLGLGRCTMPLHNAAAALIG